MIDFLVAENKIVLSVLFFIAVLILRFIILRAIRLRSSLDDEYPRRWTNTTNNIISLIIAFGLIIIWLSELRNIGLSIAAFAVAIVFATKEFIQCLLGALYLTSTRTFAIGDWIKVNHYYGKVVESDWLSTSLLEIDVESKSYEYTGKTLVIPNNHFFGATIYNLKFMKRFISHSFSIVRDPDTVNVFMMKALVLEKTKEYCAEFQEAATKYDHLMEKELGVSLNNLEPGVRISTTETLGKNIFTVSFFCPTIEAVRIEQKITEFFMDKWYAESNKNKSWIIDNNSSSQKSKEEDNQSL